MDDSILEKLNRFCSFQERCITQAFEKARSLGLSTTEAEPYISRLLSEKTIDEHRFATAFIRGKHLIKNWGKQKIMNHLKKLNIDMKLAEQVWEREISDETYHQRLKKICLAKISKEKHKSKYEIRMMCLKLAFSKGYHKDDILRVLSQLGYN